MDGAQLANVALKYAPLATPTIAFAAFVVAIAAIVTQRSTARKRAALDLFFKTEMDKTMIDAGKAYENALKNLTPQTNLDEFSLTRDYADICYYLDINELIAVGVNTGVLDDKVCFDFSADELMEPCRRVPQIIAYVRKKDGNQFTYIDLDALNFKWKQRHKEQVRRYELTQSALQRIPAQVVAT
jgi:hypothetical protein